MAVPLFISPQNLDEAGFAAGLRAMRLDGAGRGPKPQQVELAGVLGAGARFNGILLPRRSSKTTTLFVWALGRCLTMDGRRIAYTAATSGKAARDRFVKDIVPAIERSGLSGFSIKRAAGLERVEFSNGSLFQVLAPNGAELRGQAFDDVIIDEAGEATPQDGHDLLAAALPTMDTTPDGQLVLAGTAGEGRDGNLLWDQLVRGREGVGGILEYATGDLDIGARETWEQVSALLLQAHPGVGTLTTLEAVKGNWDRMPAAQFAREYLGIWGTAGMASNLFDLGAWGASALDVNRLPSPPERFALAMSAAPGQQAAAIVAAWRENGNAHLLLIDHRQGTRWLADAANRLALRYRIPIVHDNFGVVLVEADKMSRMKPRGQLAPTTIQQTTTAAAKLVEEVADGVVRHYDQEPLNAAVNLAQRRKVGDKAFAFGRSDIMDDISPVEAAALALHAYDAMPVRERIRVLRPTA